MFDYMYRWRSLAESGVDRRSNTWGINIFPGFFFFAGWELKTALKVRVKSQFPSLFSSLHIHPVFNIIFCFEAVLDAQFEKKKKNTTRHKEKSSCLTRIQSHTLPFHLFFLPFFKRLQMKDWSLFAAFMCDTHRPGPALHVGGVDVAQCVQLRHHFVRSHIVIKR